MQSRFAFISLTLAATLWFTTGAWGQLGTFGLPSQGSSRLAPTAFRDSPAIAPNVVPLPPPHPLESANAWSVYMVDLDNGDPAGTNDPLEGRIKALEDAWADQREAESKAKDKKSSDPTLDVFGRIHMDFWSPFSTSPGIGFFENPATGADPESRFEFRRVRMGIQGNLADNMVYKIAYDFGNPGDPAFKDVYIGFKELPILQTVLIGNQKRPLNLDNLNSSRYNTFMERPLQGDAFNPNVRRFGIASYGISPDEVFNWRFGVFAMEDDASDGLVVGDSLQPSYHARLASTPWYDDTSGGRGYLHLGISGMVARPDGDASVADTNNNEARFRTRPELRTRNRWVDTGRIPNAETFEIIGTEMMLNLGPWSLVGEYENVLLQRGGGSDLYFSGAYVYMAYFLTGEHQPFNRRTGTIGRVKPLENFFLVNRRGGRTGGGWGAWQVAVRFSYIDLTDDNIRGGNENNVALGLNWLWNAHSRLQFNYVYGDIDNHSPAGGFTSGTFQGIGIRSMIDF